MRRILWTLAASTTIGATVSWTMAQDRFAYPEPAVQRDPTVNRSGISFPSGRTSGAATTGSRTYGELFGEGRPFPEGRQSLPPAGSLSEARASELFRRDVDAGSPNAATGVTGEMLEDQFQRVSARSDQPNGDVVHAEYERLPGQRDRVEQVRGGGVAPEFPTTAARTQFSQFTPPVAAQAASAATDSFRSRDAGSLLIAPITTSPGAGGASQTYSSITPAVRSSRGVTFTRSSVETRTPQAADPIVPARAAAPAGDGVQAVGALAKVIRSGPQSPTVSLEWVTRGGINVGQESECSLVVKNTGIIAATNVEVSAHFPTSVRLVSAEPQPSTTESFLGWQFAELQPGQEQTIRIVLVPTEPGKVDTRADVRFSGAAATSLTVAEPLIEVTTAGPQRVLIGEPASQTVTVTNPGTGIASNVQIEAVIPAGLEHARGERLVMDIGSLNPGETRSVRLALAAVKGGTQVVQVQARADGDLVRNITADVFVVAPSLVTEIDGPSLRYLGRPAVYTLRVRNDGEINVENVRLMHKIPEGFEVVETDRGAQYDRPNRLVNWFVGRLAAGQSAEIKVTARPDQIGSFTHFVRATSEHGAISDAQFSTNVEGTPSLALEIRDLDDPVEVGNETAYEITVKNEGSAAARQVSLACEIPEGVEVLNAQGPVDSIRQRDLVTFNPVVELAPGNSVTYRIHIRGNVAGHHKVRARLSTDSNPQPVTADEATRFYGEESN